MSDWSLLDIIFIMEVIVSVNKLACEYSSDNGSYFATRYMSYKLFPFIF